MRTLDEQLRGFNFTRAKTPTRSPTFIVALYDGIDKPDVWARADEDALRLARYFAN